MALGGARAADRGWLVVPDPPHRLRRARTSHVRHDDGTEMDFGPDDVIDVVPGHDAWVVGDEPFETTTG